jgi:hypothetical protein
MKRFFFHVPPHTMAAPRSRLRPSARAKKTRVRRSDDPIGYAVARVDRWFDAHPVAGAVLSALTVFIGLYVMYAMLVMSGMYGRFIAPRVEPVLEKYALPVYMKYVMPVLRRMEVMAQRNEL